MKPYYSIADLANMLNDNCARVADALVVSGVPVIYEGKPADLSRWERIQPQWRNSDGSIVTVVTTGGLDHPLPSPEAVVVSVEALPESWISQIKAFDENEGLNGNEGSDGKPIYSTDLISILNAAIAEFFEPRRNVDARKDEVVEWIKSKMVAAGLVGSDNIAEAMFTIIKPEDHDPRKRRG